MLCWSKCPIITRHYKKHPEEAERREYKSLPSTSRETRKDHNGSNISSTGEHRGISRESYSPNYEDGTKSREATFNDRSKNHKHRDRFASGKHNPCTAKCSIDVLIDTILRELEEKQKTVDEYLLNKGFNYFRDFCTCSFSCIWHHFWNDELVNSTLKSAILFAFGIKLCWELDGFQIINNIQS